MKHEIEKYASLASPVWRLKRLYLKYKVRRMIKNYITFCERYKSEQSNMNIARGRLLKSKIMYIQSCFEAWGDYNMFGKHCFGFSEKQVQKMSDEMVWMGFTRDLRKAEWSILKQGQYPNKVNYYPEKYQQSKENKNTFYPIDYDE